jgi:hypothetical protein
MRFTGRDAGTRDDRLACPDPVSHGFLDHCWGGEEEGF